MPFNLLLLPLLGGFIFFSHWNRTAFFAKRQDKERLLLYSSLWGTLFLGFSFLGSVLIPYSSGLSSLREWWAYNTPSIQFSGISICAFLLGVGGQFVLNRIWPFRNFWNEQKEGERAVEEHGTQLEKLLFRALIEDKRVLLTLKGGKVYIGRITGSLTPQEDRDLILLPSKSGFRDEKSRVMLTTDYDLTYEMISQSEADYLTIISDFGVAIPISEVLTASLYREEVHTKYFAHQFPNDSVRGVPSDKSPPTSQNQVTSRRKDRVLRRNR
jgi:putative flippase GtrA